MLLASTIILSIVPIMGGLPIPLWASSGIFVVAWVFQFIEHKLEGKKLRGSRGV